MELRTLFKGIADAIRAHTGDTDAITASTFPERIRAIATGPDVSDATARAGDLLSGKTAYGPGGKITGTIPLQGPVRLTPGTLEQTAVPAGTYAAGAVTVAGDGALVPANIRRGASVFGVAGEAGPLPGGQLTCTGSGRAYSGGLLSTLRPMEATVSEDGGEILLRCEIAASYSTVRASANAVLHIQL